MVQLPHWPSVLERGSIKINSERLDKLRACLALFGDPHKRLPNVIHIAGTNGKGSTTAFTRSILEQSGLKVHVYTSPHLERFNERIVVAGHEISDHLLHSILEECRIISEKNNIDLSFFEATTIAAFIAFSRNPADATIIEVGLGGIYDATNVIENPAVTVITTISYDHMSILGDTLEEIAFNKAGIIKPNTPCVISMQTEEVNRVLENYAKSLNAPTIKFEHEFGVELENGLMHYKSADRSLTLTPPALPGYHQFINASNAITAVLQLTQFTITDNHIEAGLQRVQWKGRLQKITKGKLKELLPENTELWIDGAHNEGGAQCISEWLKDQPKLDTYMIFGMTRKQNTKNPSSFLSYFKGLISKIYCVNIYSEPLSFNSSEIINIINDPELKQLMISADSINTIFLEISKNLKSYNSPSRILIAGSLFLLSDFYKENN